MTFICPYCKEEITRLRYRSLINEYGNSTLIRISIPHNNKETDVEDHESDDQDIEETTYYCPECSEELNPRSVIVRDEKDKKPENKDDAEHHIEIINPRFLEQQMKDFTGVSIVCRKCKKIILHSITKDNFSGYSYLHTNRRDWETAPIECPDCGALNDPQQYIKRLNQRHKLKLSS